MELGGFDEALDTGAPLPGGGDLDIFTVCCGQAAPMIYEPEYAVYHEHRETIPQLRRQYWTWGPRHDGSFLSKAIAPTMKCGRSIAHGPVVVLRPAKGARHAASRFHGHDLRFGMAELWGGIYGLAGEYDPLVCPHPGDPGAQPMTAERFDVRHIDLATADTGALGEPALSIFWWRDLPLGMRASLQDDLPFGISQLRQLAAEYAAAQCEAAQHRARCAVASHV